MHLKTNIGEFSTIKIFRRTTVSENGGFHFSLQVVLIISFFFFILILMLKYKTALRKIRKMIRK